MFTTLAESEFFLKNIKKTDKILEYGSGQSTKEISEICDSLISVEHQRGWYDKVLNEIPKNVVLLLKEPNLNYIEGSYNCGTYEEFKDYITAPMDYGPFDIILIDGRARVECAKFAKNIANENTIIFIHDFTSRLENHGYKDIFNYLDILETVGDMSKFKLKK